MDYINAKKSLGQHFLKDRNIAQKIVGCLQMEKYSAVLEIGPGMGILTGFLMERNGIELKVIEIDPESVNYLRMHFPGLGSSIVEGDFLTTDFRFLFDKPFLIIGNFPYNISSQIFFKILGIRNRVPQVVGMIQKEVAERIASKHGSKNYGILSVILQAFYDIEYLFTVNENVFFPPPKVKSAVIRLKRNQVEKLPCSDDFFVTVVKTAFNQRRKMMRNSLKSICGEIPEIYADKRPEQLSVADFIELTRLIENLIKK